jgi:hypothetical protein
LNPGGPSAEDLINQPNIGPNVEPTQASVGYTSDEAA